MLVKVKVRDYKKSEYIFKVYSKDVHKKFRKKVKIKLH